MPYGYAGQPGSQGPPGPQGEQGPPGEPPEGVELQANKGQPNGYPGLSAAGQVVLGGNLIGPAYHEESESDPAFTSLDIKDATDGFNLIGEFYSLFACQQYGMSMGFSLRQPGTPTSGPGIVCYYNDAEGTSSIILDATVQGDVTQGTISQVAHLWSAVTLDSYGGILAGLSLGGWMDSYPAARAVLYANDEAKMVGGGSAVICRYDGVRLGGKARLDEMQEAVYGSEAGHIEWAQTWHGEAYKKVVIFLDGYHGDAASLWFPTPFVRMPVVPVNQAGLTCVFTTEYITIPATSSPAGGFIILEGR